MVEKRNSPVKRNPLDFQKGTPYPDFFPGHGGRVFYTHESRAPRGFAPVRTVRAFLIAGVGVRPEADFFLTTWAELERMMTLKVGE